MKIDYRNLFTHFIFTTLNRIPSIPEKNRERIEKYITGIVNNNSCKLYAISKAHVDKVCKYILGQKEHHRNMAFSEEFEQFIKFYQQTIRKQK